MRDPGPATLPEPLRYVLAAKVRSYLVQHDDAIRLLSEGLERHPDSPHLLRHRGEFLLTVRRYAEAIDDLSAAARLLEGRPDEIDFYRAELLPEIDRAILGQPPALLAAPTPVDDASLARWRDAYKGTLKSSTWYHLALSHYLLGDPASALEPFRVTLTHASGDDTRAAATHWLYLSLRRTGDHDGARRLLDGTPTDLHVAEPSYARCLAVYRGQADPSDAPGNEERRLVTWGYGVAAWHLLEGHREAGIAALRRVVAVGDRTSFGHLAATEDLARLGLA